ncbi:MAG: 30S ribosomal protein S6 [Deferrisomatales bacterium]
MAQQKWRRYETLVIFDPGLGTEGTDEHIQKVRDFVTNEAGRILKTERWGVRDMAFELKGRAKAYYYLIEYAGLPRVSTEVERRLNLIDTVVKFQTILLQEGIDPATLPEQEEVVAEPVTVKPPPRLPAAKADDDDEGPGETDEAE